MLSPYCIKPLGLGPRHEKDNVAFKRNTAVKKNIFFRVVNTILTARLKSSKGFYVKPSDFLYHFHRQAVGKGVSGNLLLSLL